MELEKGKIYYDQTMAKFTRFNYFSPLEPKYKFRPRVSYYAKYLVHQDDRKSYNISPVNIINYKEINTTKGQPKSCLYFKDTGLDSKVHEKLISRHNFSTTQKSVDVRKIYFPKKTKNFKIQKRQNNCKEDLTTHIINMNDTKINEFVVDEKEKYPKNKDFPFLNKQKQTPKSFKKVREMIKDKGVVNGENIDEFYLSGWGIENSSQLSEESRINLIHLA